MGENIGINELNKELSYKEILEKVNDGVWITDKNDNIIFFNYAMEKISGVKREDCIGTNVLLGFPDETVNDFRNYYLQAKKNLDPVFYEARVVTPVGRITYQQGWLTPLIKNDEFNGIICTIHDITTKKKAEEKLNVIFNSSTDAFCIQSIPDLRILEVNDEACNRFGYSKEEFKNLSVNDITATPTFSIDSEEMKKKLKKVFDGETQSFEWLSKAKDGKELWHLMTLKTIVINGKKRLLSQAKDINELKKVYDDLRVLNDELEKKVEERTKEIQKLLIQKDEMINQIGHDLKNPLGPMINLLPILIKNETDPKKVEMMKAVQKSAQYMKNLVVKSIKLSKINSNNITFHFEPLSLSTVISEVCETNQLLFDEHNITIETQVNSDFYVKADKLQLQELLNNLLNNAVKYTSMKGTIWINAQENQDMIQVSIKDEGIGMSEEQLHKIFNEFYKADESRHDFESSGLGMSICQRIIEKHGGKIWAESPGLGKGSTFYFTLPKKGN